MEKIAVLACRNHVQRSTMASCLSALQKGEQQFSGHAGAELAAVLDCGGGQDIYDPENMAKKMSRLRAEGVHTVALTGCVKPDCVCAERIIGVLSAEGLQILSKESI